MLTLVIENKHMVIVVSHTVSDRSLARLSYLHQSFKLDGVAASDIVVTLDI